MLIRFSLLLAVGIWCGQLVIGSTAIAQSSSTPTASSQVNLNLNCTVHSLVSNLAALHPVTIIEGGATKQITGTTLLTPAERLAVYQVTSSGVQSIILSSLGNAVGGMFTMGPNFSSYASSVSVPKGVTGLRDFGTAGALNLLGDLTNGGSLYGFSSNGSVNTALISAANITNLPGGIISTVLPSSLSTLSSAVPALNLSLSASNSISNAGTISSSGSLLLAAGNSISNSLPSGVVAPVPTIQGANGVTLNASTIVNSGLISALSGNIAVQSQAATDLLLTGTGGSFQAQNGDISINIPGATANNTLTATGGDYLSNNLNIDAGSGKLIADVGNVTSPINVTAGSASVGAHTQNLTLGTINVTGDLTLYNAGGSLTLNPISQIDGFTLPGLWVDGRNVTLLASGDIIYTGNSQIVTVSQSGGNGGNLTIIAGSNITTSATNFGTTVTVSGPSSTGGAIDLSACTLVGTEGKYVNSTLNGIGGNILMVAYAGSGAGSSYTPGTINLPNSIAAFDQNVPDTQSGGDITIISGATSVPHGTLAINFPYSNVTSNGSISAGQLGTQIYQATPVGSLTIQDGTIIQNSITPGQLQPVDIGSATNPVGSWFINQVSFATAGNIFVHNSQNLSLGQVTFGSTLQITAEGSIFVGGNAIGVPNGGNIVGLSSNSSATLISNYYYPGFGNPLIPNGGILQAGNASISASNVNLITTGPGDIVAAVNGAKSIDVSSGGNVVLTTMGNAPSGGTPIKIDATGSVAISSQSDLHVTGITTTTAPDGSAGNISLTAVGSIATGKLVAAPDASGNGATISLIAGGDISTGDLLATAGNNSGNGGTIIERAGGSITNGDLKVSSATGSGGTITVTSTTANISLGNVYATGLSAGGTITLETPATLIVQGTISAPGGVLTAGAGSFKLKTIDMGSGTENIGTYTPIGFTLVTDEFIVETDQDI